MYKNKTEAGLNNLCGASIRQLRKKAIPKLSQRGLSDELQRRGLDVDKNAIQRIEAGKRFVTDIELKKLAEIFNVSCDDLPSQ